MDSETAVECYIEFVHSGRYKEDAVDILLDEVRRSTTLGNKDKMKLTRQLMELRETGSFGNTAIVNQIWNTLKRRAGFRRAWAEVVTNMFIGKRKRLA